jgi:hypothetical protein
MRTRKLRALFFLARSVHELLQASGFYGPEEAPMTQGAFGRSFSCDDSG